jgi:hypothetical protein
LIGSGGVYGELHRGKEKKCKSIRVREVKSKKNDYL